MKKEDIIKQLIPGILVGMGLGTLLGYLVGVDNQDVMKNNIGGLMSCLIPCILNCTIVLKGTANILKRKLSIVQAFTNSIIEIIIGALFGFFFHFVIVGKLLNINTCEWTRMQMTIVNMVLGVIVSTVMAYVALKRYEKKKIK